MAKISINNIEEEYKYIHNDLLKFENALLTQLDELFKKNIKLGFPIQHRVKTLDSIKEKHESKRYTIKKSIQELQDLVGFRIILLFRRDVAEVIKLIEENFEILTRYDSIDKLPHNQFGYSSMHINVKIKQEWCSVPTFRGLDDYKAEIQIRTLSQHNWAETSNYFQYKNEDNVPKQILRTIGRVSALLETVDLELERTLDERETYINNINIQIDEVLNVENMKAVFSQLLPSKIEQDYANYSTLSKVLKYFNISTVSELVNYIKEEYEFTEVIKVRDLANNEWNEFTYEDLDTVMSLIITSLRYYNTAKWLKFAAAINEAELEEENKDN